MPDRRRLIDPHNCTDYNRSYWELEAFLLFCIAVAGKNADQTRDKINGLLKAEIPNYMLPLGWLWRLEDCGLLEETLRDYRLGQYARIKGHILAVKGFDLRTVVVDELERFVGPKTARYFILHTRRNARCVPLDTHLLSWMREITIGSHVWDISPDDIPRFTPSAGTRYRYLERIAVKMMQSIYPAMTLAEADLHIWQHERERKRWERSTAGRTAENTSKSSTAGGRTSGRRRSTSQAGPAS